MNREDLNRMVWYRTLKVFYIMFFLFSLAVSFGIVNELSNDKLSVIHCDSGKEFPQISYYPTDGEKLKMYKECDIAGYFFSSSDVKGQLTEEKRAELNGKVLEMVKNGALESEIKSFVNDFKTANVMPRDPLGIKKYTVEELENKYGHSLSESFKVGDVSWVPNFKVIEKEKYNLADKIKFQALSFVAVCVVFWLISRIFFYISIREKFLKLL